MPINYSLVVLIGFLSGIIFSAFLKRLALRYKIFVAKDTPLTGGISMGLSFIITCLFIFFINSPPLRMVGVVVSSLIMLVFGIVDDLKELNVPAKFFVQFVATSLLIIFGVRTNIVYIGNFLNIVITFVWVLGITNAFNLLDIMDGAASVIALMASISFFVVSLLNADISNLLLSLALSGVILSFLIYNLPPAKIYMGNSGSHFLGFVLASVALMISYASMETKIALISPLLILGFPIFDTAFLIIMRLRKKRLPFYKTNDHLALRLLMLGYSKRKALLIIFFSGLFFSACGVIISQVSWPKDLAIIILAVSLILVLSKKMSKVAIYD